ncbi:MAG: DNA polymerase III subunit beta [Cyanobacteriota bacterium]|nr:DNA polymerase III subunit beta [Cyanobacteriota bacterium]
MVISSLPSPLTGLPDRSDDMAEGSLKLVCSQSNLHQHLASVSRAVASRPAMPVLGNVLLEADAERGMVALTAFDLSLGIRSEFAAAVEEGGRTTLPARLLNDIVSRLPNGDLTLEQGDPDSPMLITSGMGQYQVRGLNAEDYPSLPEIAAAETLLLQIESLLQGISQTLFAASGDDTKQVLTGVHVKVKMEDVPMLEFAATDGHRLATMKTPLLTDPEAATSPSLPSQNVAFTIPARTLREVERILNQQSATTLTLQFDRSQVQFGLDHHLITSRLLDGQYPDYDRLIPTTFERSVTAERKRLIECLERIAVFAAQKNDIVKFSLAVDSQALTISTEAPDVGSGEESLSIQFSGTDLEIAFNVKYLLDALKVIQTQEVKLLLNGATQPAIWQPVGAMQLRYLVMPVQIRSA